MLDTKAKLVGLDLGRYKCKAITIDYTGKETVASFLTKRSFWTPRKTDMPLMKGSYVLEVNGEKQTDGIVKLHRITSALSSQISYSIWPLCTRN